MLEADTHGIDKFGLLILSNVHEKNVTDLKANLLTVSNPNFYLNQLYDQSNGQKCTLLTIACLQRCQDIMIMLLSNFQPDLEILNVVELEDDDSRKEVYRDVTLLWVAAAIDELLIVKQLVEHGANINHTTNTNSTAVRCACFNRNIEMVRYLVKYGADIKINKINNETNLSLAVYREHLELTKYLVDELGCDINEYDDDGRSPLYFAVKRGSSQLVSYLISRGALNFPAHVNQLSPIMLAAEERRIDLVDIISVFCSPTESIEVEELLASSFACAELGDCDLAQMYEHLCRAFELRSIYNIPKPQIESRNAVFKNRQECQTIDELDNIRSDSESMHIEALLIRERLFGVKHEKYHYSILYRGAILADNEEFHDALAMWIYQFELCKQCSIVIHREDMRRLVALLGDMFYHSSPVPSGPLHSISTLIIENMKNSDYNLYTFLFLTTIVSQLMINGLLPSIDYRVFCGLLRSVNQNGFVTSCSQSNLLHLCLSDQTVPLDRIIKRVCKYPCHSTARLLLNSGIDVNSVNASGNTPLHILALNKTLVNRNIIKLLFDVGAHSDVVNTEIQRPIDLTSNSIVKAWISKEMKISLKCSCARVIKRTNLPIKNILTNSLLKFIEMH